MRRGTTPTFTVTVDADITAYLIYLTFKDGDYMLTKTNDDLTIAVDEGVTSIDVTLTQAETLAFKSGSTVDVQIRAVDANGATAIATTIGSVSVDRILLGGVLP